jgi:hypothetical protein
MKKRVASAYGKEGEEDTERYEIKTSIMQSCKFNTTEVYRGKSGKNREGGRKGTVGLLRSLTSNKLHGVLSQNVFISVPCYVCSLSKGLLKNVCSVLLLRLFSLKPCFQFHNNAFN